MLTRPFSCSSACLAIAASAVLADCGGGGDDAAPATAPVTIASVGASAVSSSNETATATINQPATAGGTPEEARPNYAVDLATVHVAIYDAVMAIAKTHQPYAIAPVSPADGASQEAATAAAAYGVLKGLYPSRSATYQTAYDSSIAAIADGTAKTRGLTLGAEVASRILTLRANDGRSVAYPVFVSGVAAGQFRTATNPAGRENPFIRPFVIVGTSQFRAHGPPALTSPAYAADVNETKAFGATASATRTDAQTEMARFHTEPPPLFWTRNLRAFATTNASLAEQARLIAIVWVTHADAANACFESKYTYLAWRRRRQSRSTATATRRRPTPNHPEYPAAQGCVSGAMAEILRLYCGTDAVSFDLTSTVTAGTHHFASLSAPIDEVTTARIGGGMHFRTSLVDGEALGKSVADWVVGHAFQKR